MSEQQRRHRHVVNLAEIPGDQMSKGSRFGYTFKGLGRATAGRGIGCTWYEVPPGRTAFPYHYHTANEEALFILEGEGDLRIGAETVKIGPGDYVALPTGPDTAHQLLNSGSAPLRYLALSTMATVEIVGYPDSNKVGAAAVTQGPEGERKLLVRNLFRAGESLDYYDGEDVD